LPEDLESREKIRSESMLDDETIRIAKMEPRVEVPAYEWIFFILSLLTLGNLSVIAAWDAFRLRSVFCTTRECSMAEASKVIVTSLDGQYEVCEVEEVLERPIECLGYEEALKRRRRGSIDPLRRMIVYRHTRFLLRDGCGLNVGIGNCSGGESFVQLHPDEAPPPDSTEKGLPVDEAAARLNLFGRNVIDVPIPPWPTLLIRECVHPFVVFQVWAVVVWVSEGYYSFSLFIFASAMATAVTNLLDLLKNLREIRRLSLFTAPCNVLRGDGGSITVDSSQLIPGDVIVLDGASKVPADIVLLSGGVSVTEALLTGEATVVPKSPLPVKSSLKSALLAPPRRCTLFCGTQVVTSRPGTTGLVVRTGFDTVKGRLVLSILYPRPTSFKFLEQSLRFIAILFALAMLGFVINAKALSDFNASPAKIVQRGADMVTIVVPPALPLAVTVGVIYALMALRKKSISCISPTKVNVAGKVNSFVFDKTGTLTEEGLRLECVRPSVDGVWGGEAKGGDLISPLSVISSPLLPLLATCHSLVLVDGKIAGDPLEVEVFSRMSGAELEGDGDVVSIPGTLRGIILHRFEFSSQTSRMGALVELKKRASRAGEDVTELWSFFKGAPEIIVGLCSSASLPANFSAVLEDYSRKGLRVLGAAGSPYSGITPRDGLMSEEDLTSLRAAAEKQLEFLGLIVLENPLKPASAPTIARLRRETGMPLFMATGDNPISALAVARQCGIIDPTIKVYLGDLCRGDDASSSGVGGGLSPNSSLTTPNPGEVSPSAATGGGEKTLVWRCTDAPALQEEANEEDYLDPVTLLPGYLPGGLAATTSAKKHNFSSAAQTRRFFLAMTGRAFLDLQGRVKDGSIPLDHLQKVVLNCPVFARMSPEAKAALVVTLQEAGLYVGMIGDGANDSMALKASHVGISLSTVEASVAAPFTSANPTIEAIPVVLAEGRGALATSFSLFQFMALYSTIQFSNALLVVFFNSFLSNNMYLYQDLWIVFVLSLTLGATPSSERLGKKRPSGRLFSAFNLSITFAFIATTFIVQVRTFNSHSTHAHTTHTVWARVYPFPSLFTLISTGSPPPLPPLKFTTLPRDASPYRLSRC